MRPLPTRGRARVARGLVAASVCTLLSVCGHVAAGGARPAIGLLAVLALPLAGLLITLADRRRGPLAILVLVGGSQLALHELLELLGGSAHQHLAKTLAFEPVLMTGAHVVATLASAAVLAGAENAVFTVAAALARVLPRPPAALPCPEPPRLAAVVVIPLTGRLRGVLGRRLHGRRGPPPMPSVPLHP